MFWSFILLTLHNVNKNSLRVIFDRNRKYKTSGIKRNTQMTEDREEGRVPGMLNFLFLFYKSTLLFLHHLCSRPLISTSPSSLSPSTMNQEDLLQTSLPFILLAHQTTPTGFLGFQQPTWMRSKWASKAGRQISDLPFLLFLHMDLQAHPWAVGDHFLFLLLILCIHFQQTS